VYRFISVSATAPAVIALPRWLAILECWPDDITCENVEVELKAKAILQHEVPL
jgi:hypothetical protein